MSRVSGTVSHTCVPGDASCHHPPADAGNRAESLRSVPNACLSLSYHWRDLYGCHNINRNQSGG